MDLELSSAPSESDVLNLVSVAEIKAHENITHTQHDAVVIPNAIKHAYAYLDGQYGWLNRSILTQTWKLYQPSFCDHWELPKGPVQSITSIEYYDSDNALQTLASSAYELQKGLPVARVDKTYNTVWPTLYSKRRAVVTTYVAGFGTSTTMPFPTKMKIKQAILWLAIHLYRNQSPTHWEPRTIHVNRTVQYGLKNLIGFLRIPPDHR